MSNPCVLPQRLSTCNICNWILRRLDPAHLDPVKPLNTYSTYFPPIYHIYFGQNVPRIQTTYIFTFISTHAVADIFTALQPRSCYEQSVCLSSVCPSVRTSVKHINCDNFCPHFIYHLKDRSFWFSNKKNDWWGKSRSTWNFGPNWPTNSKKFNYHW